MHKQKNNRLKQVLAVLMVLLTSICFYFVSLKKRYENYKNTEVIVNMNVYEDDIKEDDATAETIEIDNNEISRSDNSEDEFNKLNELNLQIFIEEIFKNVNNERKNIGLEAVIMNEKLNNLARIKAKDMIENQYFDHKSPTYGQPLHMLTTNGVNYNYVGENIARGQISAKEVMNDWMKSETHKNNILNTNFSEIGIGIVKDDSGMIYWVQLFGG